MNVTKLFLVAAAITALPHESMAQNAVACRVVSSCATMVYSAGALNTCTQDTTGQICTAAVVSATATIAPFTPTTQATLNVTNLTSNIILPSGTSTVLCNSGSVPIFYKFGTNTVTAAVTDIKLPSGICIADAPGAGTYVAAIVSTGTATLDISGGAGLPAFGTIPVSAGSSTNLTAINGVAPLVGLGVAGTGSLRVAVSSDSTYTVAATQSGVWNIGTITTLPGVTQSGAWIVQPGNVQNTTPWLTSVVGGGNLAMVKAASTPAAAIDPALVVAISRNNTVAAAESGIWTVQPGNTANTTPWLMSPSTGGNTAAVKAASTAAAATDPALVVAVSPNNTIAATESGTWTVQPGNTANTTPWLVAHQAAATGGATPVHYLSAATTNATNVKASAGTVSSITAVNTTAVLYYLKLYDKATAPTCGTDTPVQTYPVPASATGAGLTVNPPTGLAFTLGIGFCLTGALTDADATSAATGVAINFGYK
jgi:hypothetical protein